MSELYPYQEQGVEFISKKRRVILADEMGLGKTLQALKAIDNASDRYPALIVVGLKIAFGVWQSEIKKWLDMDSEVYTGNEWQRDEVWERWRRNRTPFLITNRSHLAEVVNRQKLWRAVVFDEYHLMGLRNRKTATFRAAKQLYSGIMILSSGSPMSQGPQDLWPALHLINPRKYSSYWAFVNKYCVVEDDKWGKKIGRHPKRPKEFREMLSDYMIRRLKKDVLQDLPDKTRQIVPLEMTPRQNTAYRQFARDMLAETEKGVLMFTPTVIAKIMRLRQLLVSPQLLGITEKGAALEALKDIAEVEFEAGNSIAVFTPFREGVRVAQKELREITKHVYTLMGGMEREEVARTIRAFQENPSRSKALISTIKSAVSFTAHSANVAIFLGQEWDYNDNVQAEDRLHRVGQKNAVRVYYMSHKDTLDSHVLDIVLEKRNAIKVALRQEHFFPS